MTDRTRDECDVMGGEKDKHFTVRALKVEDEQKAKFLEALCNRPDFVARVMDEVEKKAKEHMDFLLWGYPDALRGKAKGQE